MWACHRICLRPYSVAYGVVAHRSLYSDSILKDWVSWVRLVCHVEAGYSLSFNQAGEDSWPGPKANSLTFLAEGFGTESSQQVILRKAWGFSCFLQGPNRKERRCRASGDRVGPSAPSQGQQCFPTPHTSASRCWQGGAHTPSPLSAAHSFCESST